jgi:hypothetical protein
MSNVAKVWNDGPTDYTERFRDSDITIRKGEYIEMDRYEASAFLSQYIKPKKTDTGIYLNHKQLRMEVPSDAPEAKVEHRCMLCKGLFATANELTLHSDMFHPESQVEDKEKRKK